MFLLTRLSCFLPKKAKCLILGMDRIQVKADVETQGDFIMSLATEVRAASFTNIEDLVAFVNWLDEELSFLVCPL